MANEAAVGIEPSGDRLSWPDEQTEIDDEISDALSARRKAQRLSFRSSMIRFLNSSISGRILLQ